MLTKAERKRGTQGELRQRESMVEPRISNFIPEGCSRSNLFENQILFSPRINMKRLLGHKPKFCPTTESFFQ